MAVLYTFDTAGHICGRTTNGESVSGGCALIAPGVLRAPDMLPATVTVTQADGSASTYDTTVESGWCFTLDADGNPALDTNGKYAVTPPQPQALPPDTTTYSLLAAVKGGVLNPATDIDPNTVNAVNQSLAAAGLPPLPGTTLVPLPTCTAVCGTGPAG
jgi:hypothetical protein